MLAEVKRKKVAIPFSAKEMEGAFVPLTVARKRRNPAKHKK